MSFPIGPLIEFGLKLLPFLKRKKRKPLVLVVDDSRADMELIRSALIRCGCDVMAAYNGKDSLEILHREKVALLWVDLNMPGQGGLTTIAEVRPSFPHLPIVLCAGSFGAIRCDEIAGQATVLVKKPLAGFYALCDAVLTQVGLIPKPNE